MAHSILLPSGKFFYLHSDPESNQNNLYAETQENDLPLLYAATIDDFSKINAKISFEDENNISALSRKISVRKSYQAFFYPQGEDLVIPLDQSGFDTEDGKLVSSPEAIYILSENQKLPIDNPITFESLGYNWNNVFSLDEENLSRYEKGKLINIRSPHPSGTVFHTIDTDKYFYISNKEKREIKGSQELIVSYMKDKPVVSVSEKSLSDYRRCSLEKTGIFFPSYNCSIDASSLIEYPGKNYEFFTQLESPEKIRAIQIEFKKDITWKNIRTSLSLIKSKIMLKYLNK